MPSLFPGMDPYLEGSLWSGVHAGLSMEIVRQLSPQLQPRYVARANERLVTVVPGEDDTVAIRTASIYPDAFIAEGNRDTSQQQGGGLAVAPVPLHLATVMPQTVRHLTVEILDVAQQRLVTAIEVLSPSNKRGEGRGEYLSKRQKILLSRSHLMEIDLLRLGQRVPMQEKLPGEPYFVLLSRSEDRPVMEVWPIKLSEHLPTVPVPLLPGDRDVAIDLQAAFSSVYDLFGYAFTIDYAQLPEVRLSEPDATWAENVVGATRKQQ